MTWLAFLAGVLLGGLTVGWAARQQIRETQAEALRLLYVRHSIEVSVEDAARRSGV